MIAVLTCILVLAAASMGVRPADAADDRALRIAAEVERLTRERSLWPGYDPLAIPLAIYDGERTLLFRHPSTPSGFAPLTDARPAALAHQGRHPAVVSNTSAEIGGTMTATLLAEGSRASATELAAVALHEAFHVYQRQHHPGWIGNEGVMLLYPAENAPLLALRRQESAVLRRALAAADANHAACWTQQALAFRRERFAATDSSFVRYERLTELNEGLATYVQVRAAGQDSVHIPTSEWRPAEIRLRTYAIGPALGLLLDRFAPGWKESLESKDDQFLDEMLSVSLGGTSPSDKCMLSRADIDDIERRARADAEGVVAERTTRREAFDARNGWRVVVHAAANQPLWPQGFDPLNVERVTGGLLHTRLLELKNDSSSMLVIDEAGADIDVLTEGAGAHPLFNGVQRLEIAGLPRPTMTREGNKLSLRAAGLTGDFNAATVHEDAVAQRIEIQLTR